MPGQGRFRDRSLRLALIMMIAAGGAGACYSSVSAADAHTCLMETLEQVNIFAEAAATQIVRLLTECRIDLASF